MMAAVRESAGKLQAGATRAGTPRLGQGGTRSGGRSNGGWVRRRAKPLKGTRFCLLKHPARLKPGGPEAPPGDAAPAESCLDRAYQLKKYPPWSRPRLTRPPTCSTSGWRGRRRPAWGGRSSSCRGRSASTPPASWCGCGAFGEGELKVALVQRQPRHHEPLEGGMDRRGVNASAGAGCQRRSGCPADGRRPRRGGAGGPATCAAARRLSPPSARPPDRNAVSAPWAPPDC